MMNEMNLVSNKPTGFYAIPVNKNTLSYQPIQTVKNLINEHQNQQQLALINNKQDTKRTVTVSGTGELKLPPDQVKLVIVITNVKSNIDEAKASVHRRYEYVYQTLRKHKINETNIYVNTSYNRKEDNNYEVRCEISTDLSDFKIYLQIYNILVEKLDKSVKILEPHFSHTSSRIEAIKRQTTVQAIRNAKRTALDLANSVSLSLGKPIDINQECFRETWGESPTYSSNQIDQKSASDLINEKTITVMCNVKVTFELLKPKRHE